MKRINAWKDYRQLSQQQLPARVRPWLLDRCSLTSRLIAASQQFRVEVIEQSWRYPHLNEARLLNMPSRQKALIREVLLICDDEPWVYARSVIPAKSLQGRLGFLRQLQNSALGALLFKDPSLQRSHFQVAQIDLPQANIPVKQQARVYGRRSLFHLYQQPLLVAEVFLPACNLSANH